jgi:hypothetical protein
MGMTSITDLVSSPHPTLLLLLTLDVRLGFQEYANNARKTGYLMQKMSAFLFPTNVSLQIILETVWIATKDTI